MGYATHHLRKEQFEIWELPPFTRRWYDEEDRIITLLYRGESRQVLVPYRQSILDAAMAAGIQLPYSCHAGRCSTCVCKVLSGTVWMHYNEVLTADDEANGLALTCTGHPASSNVVVQVT